MNKSGLNGKKWKVTGESKGHSGIFHLSTGRKTVNSLFTDKETGRKKMKRFYQEKVKADEFRKKNE